MQIGGSATARQVELRDRQFVQSASCCANTTARFSPSSVNRPALDFASWDKRTHTWLSLRVRADERDHPTVHWYLVNYPSTLPHERVNDIRQAIGGKRARTIIHLKVQMRPRRA